MASKVPRKALDDLDHTMTDMIKKTREMQAAMADLIKHIRIREYVIQEEEEP